MTEVMTMTKMDCLVVIHQKHNHLVQVVKRIPSSFSFISFVKSFMFCFAVISNPVLTNYFETSGI